MPDFRCRLATPTGEIFERDFSAADATSLRRELENSDYLVLSIQRRSAALAAAQDLMRRRQRVNMNDFMFFNQEFSALIRAGLPIVESLGMLIERRQEGPFRTALEDVRRRLKGGESLSEAFAAQEVTPSLYASTLASGERSGEIASVLQRYVHYAKTVASVRRKIVAAVTYPAILVVLAIVIVAIVLIYVMPNFQDFFEQLGSELPAVTRFVIGMSDFMVNRYLLILGVLAGVIVGWMVWRRTPGGQRALEKVLYRIPLVGPLARSFVVTRLARTLSTLVAGGMPLVECLGMVSRGMDRPMYRESLRKVTDKVREGAALWSALDEAKLYPDNMIEMVKVGESSGTVAEMLEHVADFIDEKIDYDLQRLVSLVEPIMLIVMALLVGGMLLAIYYPMLVAYANSQL
jgi:type IV pilus assembly protein PilC